jgi:hypothetical protein
LSGWRQNLAWRGLGVKVVPLLLLLLRQWLEMQRRQAVLRPQLKVEELA